MTIKTFLATAILASAVAGASNAATIVNGSFEADATTGQYDTFFAGGVTSMTGWTVGSGSVDLVNSTLWDGEQGSQSVDLDGSAVGSIFQTINDLVVGVQYTMSFYMSGNTAGAPVVKTLDVSIGMNEQSFSFDSSGGGAQDDVWELKTFDFTAGQEMATLMFDSTTGGNFYGAVIDNVTIAETVSSVPLPAGGLLLLSGLGVLAMRRKRS